MPAAFAIQQNQTPGPPPLPQPQTQRDTTTLRTLDAITRTQNSSAGDRKHALSKLEIQWKRLDQQCEDFLLLLHRFNLELDSSAIPLDAEKQGKHLQESAHLLRTGFQELVYLEPGMEERRVSAPVSETAPNAAARLQHLREQLSAAGELAEILKSYADAESHNQISVDTYQQLLRQKSDVRAAAANLEVVSRTIRHEARLK